MPTDPSIFKAYDIRGIYPSQMDDITAYEVGLAFANLIQKEKNRTDVNLVVGRDMRLSGPNLKTELIRGITEAGANVIDIDLASTPTFYFAVAYYGYDGGVQISASHNPGEYNGFKMVRANAVPVSGDSGIMDIKAAVVEKNFTKAATPGTITTKEGVLAELIQVETKDIDVSAIKPFTIVVDPSNAMGSLDIEAIFAKLPCKIIKMNWELDGSFPNHEADPLKEENLDQLRERVVHEKADFGISPDGDADRVFFVDSNGKTFSQALLRGIMAQIAVKENPGATICYDIRPGKITRDLIDEVGGKASVTKVGHSLIKEQMIKENAVFGGESSGHYFYQFPYGTFEAPAVLILKFLQFLSTSGMTLTELAAKYDRYVHSGEINSKVVDKDKKIKALAEKYQDAEISYLDGITVTYPTWWFNVRGSNTEPALRLNLEAVDAATMQEKRDEVLALIRN
jgi:phosphomannomutase